MQSDLVWNYFLRIFIETSLDLYMINMLRLQRDSIYDNEENRWTILVSIATLILTGLFHIGSTYCLCKHRELVNEDAFQEKYGSLAPEIKEKLEAVAYTPVFMMRRLMMALTIVFLYKKLFI